MEVLISPAEAAQRLGIGRTSMFALLGNGTIPSVKIGRLRRVPAIAIDEYVRHLREKTGSAA